MRVPRWLLIGLVSLSFGLGASLPAQAQGSVAVWANGQLSDGGNGICAFINGLPGGFSCTMVTTAQLATPNFLTDNAFNAVYITRFGASSLSSSLGNAAAANVANYVGPDGVVVLFMNDWHDNLPTAVPRADPVDNNTSELIEHAVSAAVACGHGYVGELPGGAMGLTANSDGLSPLALIRGTAGPVVPFPCQDVTITGAGGFIQGSVPTTFTPLDPTCFRSAATGVDPAFVLATYADGVPAIIGSPGGPGAPPRPALRPVLTGNTTTAKQ